MSEGLRAAEYRLRAAEMTKQAATFEDPQMRAWYLDIASRYIWMAEHLEKRGDPATEPEKSR